MVEFAFGMQSAKFRLWGAPPPSIGTKHGMDKNIMDR
jgi:hypothetical protein